MALSICRRCGREFHVKPSWLKKGFGVYCSRKCHHQASRKGKTVLCHNCGAESYRQPKELHKSKSGKFFCSKSCQTRWRNQLYVGKKHKNFRTGEASYRAVMERSGVPKICRLCRTEDARVLAVHHIDKNRQNNKLENLAWLCHNCHFLVHHYQEARKQFMAAIV
jgi:hypothetical protein